MYTIEIRHSDSWEWAFYNSFPSFEEAEAVRDSLISAGYFPERIRIV